ncbi:hypothetical protein [Novosphingobium sp.]|uniref:hypothetical protein n=1 Tax=Novosphingobium sp. TaxID=1874826 RepID=UPI0025F277F5|nr:hypothetical protein [Novosphingobium sp.]
MKTLSKALVGTIAAGAVAISSATPAMAETYGHRDRDGISAGDVIAGALVIGGIAAVASAASRDRGYDGNYDRSYDRNYGSGYDRDYRNGGAYGYDGNYRYGGNPRQAVEQCVAATERTASRYSYGRADVTDIREVRNTRDGYEVKGRIAVNQSNRGWRSGESYYGRGWGGDYRGWNNNLRGYDSGSFKCKFERGRVVDVDFSGIRGL